MKRLFRFLLVLLVIVVGVAVYTFWPLSPNLKNIAPPSQTYDVEILRDTWGVPHIFGVTDADAAFGLAYANAEDDFLTIQQGAIAARGKLATVYGADAAPNDFMVELLRIWDVVDAQYDVELSPEVRAICEAYAAGLNQYASEHEDEAFPGLFPMTGKDVVAGAVHKSPLFFGLDGTLGRLFSQTEKDDEAAGLAPSNPMANLWPESMPELIANQPLGPVLGSNAFAVAPSRSADNSTYLAVNSHQPWTGPVAWFEAHVHSEEGWDMVGALFPGMPVLVHGHNRDLGWAFTVNSPDLKDVFELTLNPDNGDQYWLDGAWVDFEKESVWLAVNVVPTLGWGDETFGRLNVPIPQTIYWSEFGPVIRGESSAFAIRYPGFGSVGIYEQLYRLNKATSLDEFQAAFRDVVGLPMFNVVYADKAGNIGYVYNALMPQRVDGYDWEENVPGESSEQIWSHDAYVPFDDLPQVWNPSTGFIQNANSSPFNTTFNHDDNPDFGMADANWGVETTMSNRSLRLLELFEADDSITWDEFIAYKYDMTFSADSDIPDYIGVINSAEWPTPHHQTAADLLAEWNLETHPDSLGASVMMATLYFLNEAPEADVSASNLVGGNVPNSVLLASFEKAADHLEDNFGTAEVAYADLNRIRRGDLDIGLGGAPDVPHAIYGSWEDDGRIAGIAGDSYIIMVEWGQDGAVRSESVHQFGSATLDENSVHYNDQAPLLANRDLKPVWLDEAEIRDNLGRAYRPND